MDALKYPSFSNPGRTDGHPGQKAERPPSLSSIPMIRIRRPTVCSRRRAVAKCPAQTRRHRMTAGKNSPYPGRPSETHKQIACGEAAGSGRKTVRRQHERLQSGVSPHCRSPAARPLTGDPTPCVPASEYGTAVFSMFGTNYSFYPMALLSWKLLASLQLLTIAKLRGRAHTLLRRPSFIYRPDSAENLSWTR